MKLFTASNVVVYLLLHSSCALALPRTHLIRALPATEKVIEPASQHTSLQARDPGEPRKPADVKMPDPEPSDHGDDLNDRLADLRTSLSTQQSNLERVQRDLEWWQGPQAERAGYPTDDIEYEVKIYQESERLLEQEIAETEDEIRQIEQQLN